MKRSPIEYDQPAVDPVRLRQQLGGLTTVSFRAAVLHCAPAVRHGIFDSILDLREVSENDATAANSPQRAMHDVTMAERVGQLNIVGLGLCYEDTSIRSVLCTDSERWHDTRARGSRRIAGVRTVLRLFFTDPGYYVDGAGRFLPDLGAKSRDYRYGQAGGFVFARFRTAGDDGHQKLGPGLRRWGDELRRSNRQDDGQ